MEKKNDRMIMRKNIHVTYHCLITRQAFRIDAEEHIKKEKKGINTE